MDGLNSLSMKLDIRPPLQVRESQGPQNFHLFPGFPPEIREKIWKFSFPDARTIRVCPIMPKEDDPPLLLDENKGQVLVEFSYEDDNPIVALKTSRESREIALSVYQIFVKGGRRIYFCPDRDTLLFTGLKAVFLMLLCTGGRPGFVTQLLKNTFAHEASQLTDSSTTIKWSATLENITSYGVRQGRPITTYRPPPPRSESRPSKFLRQASTSHKSQSQV